VRSLGDPAATTSAALPVAQDKLLQVPQRGCSVSPLGSLDECTDPRSENDRQTARLWSRGLLHRRRIRCGPPAPPAREAQRRVMQPPFAYLRSSADSSKPSRLRSPVERTCLPEVVLVGTKEILARRVAGSRAGGRRSPRRSTACGSGHRDSAGDRAEGPPTARQPVCAARVSPRAKRIALSIRAKTSLALSSREPARDLASGIAIAPRPADRASSC
jgi:hypothetical protein